MHVSVCFTVASTRLQQQKQHLHRLQLQASATSSVMSGGADVDSATFGFHPANFLFNSFPALSTLVATDWKNVQGQGQPIEQIEQSCIQQTVQKGKVQGTILTIEKCMAECSPQFIRRIYRKVYMTSGQCDANLRLPSRPQSTAFTVRRVVISRPAAGRRLSGPKWLVTCARTVTHLGTNRARRRVTSLPLQSCTQPRPSAPFSQKVVQYSRSRGASPRNRWGGHFPPLLSRWCS